MIWSSLLASALLAFGVVADDTPAKQEASFSTENKLNVDVQTRFSLAEDTFGLKLVNGRPTRISIDIANHDDASTSDIGALTVSFVGGALYPAPQLGEEETAGPGEPPNVPAILNLTTVSYMAEPLVVAPGQEATIPYEFTHDILPRDVRLRIVAYVVTERNNQVLQIVAYNGHATVVDAPVNLLDPRVLFSYLVVLATVGAAAYAAYQTWLLPYIQPASEVAASSEAASRRKANKNLKNKNLKPALTHGSDGEGTAGSASDSATPVKLPASASGIDSWIPEHHLRSADTTTRRSTRKTKKAE